jgi:hypothetical protein
MQRTHTWRWSVSRLGLVAVVALVLVLGTVWRGDGPGVATVAAGGAPITITAVDYAFEGVPARVPVGTAFALVNVSPVELHELVALRIAAGETRSVADLVQLPDEALVGVIAEMPAMVLIAPPRAPGFAVLGDGRFTERGRYALVCFIPTGADPAAYLAAAAMDSEGPPAVAGGPPHAFLGMIAEVVVE